jgi:hypothetical protein
MRSNVSLYTDLLKTLKRKYIACKKIQDPTGKSLELIDILTQLHTLDKSNCPENKKESFEIKIFHLHILYMAIFDPKETPLPEDYKLSPSELLWKYNELKANPNYTELDPQRAIKQTIDEHVAKLESELEQNKKFNLPR